MNREPVNLNEEIERIDLIGDYKKITTNAFQKRFSKFVVYSLRLIFIIIAIAAVGTLVYFSIFRNSVLNIGLIGLYIILGFGVYSGIKKKVEKKTMLYLMIFLGLILRSIWAFSVENIPVSDFEVVYNAAINVSNGNYNDLKGLAYFGRFPHMTMLVLYFSQMISLFKENSLIAIRAVNVMFGTSTILFIYLICKEVFKDDTKVMLGTFFAAIMPSSILYTAVYCSENLAIPFYLASIYCFILVVNGRKQDKLLILSGLLLVVGHLFRMIAQIMVISYIMYIVIYLGKNHLKKFKNVCYLLISFIIPFLIVGNLLVSLGITDRKLWNGSEPNITSALRGSNIDHLGRWNEEDAKFISENLEDRDNLEAACKNIIINRYTTTSPIKIAGFIVAKVAMQWMQGDNAGAFWSQYNLSEDNVKFDIGNKGSGWYQLFYVLLLILIIKGLFNKKEYLENNIINIFYIIFCGYGLAYLILESQERYAFIISWVFVILPLTALSKESKFYKKYLE